MIEIKEKSALETKEEKPILIESSSESKAGEKTEETDGISSNMGDLADNFVKIVGYWQDIAEEYAKRISPDGEKVPSYLGGLGAFEAFGEFMSEIVAHPEKMVEAGLTYYNEYIKMLTEMNAQMNGSEVAPKVAEDKKDRRFKDVVWNENILFDFIKRSYLLTCGWMQRMVRNIEFKDKNTARKVDFYTRQFLDAISPSNFAITNPEVLRETITSNGANLAKGMENLLNDLKNSKSYLSVKVADDKAFEVGRNLAVTPGKVIFQNDLMQLIQYNSSTASVYKTPMLIVPAWINKYYILDMKPENSFIKWLVDQGHTVFAISWVNPDKTLARKTFEDYMFEGPLDAMKAIKLATGEKEINVAGYCLGGSLMACTIAYLKAREKDAQSQHDPKIKSMTYLTTMIDFSDPGDLGVFIDDWHLDELEKRLEEQGYFDGSDMAAIFSVLRSRDLIWSFVVNNYLMGKAPFPFDMLYWNSDSTRLPAQMHIYYLRNMYRDNLMIKTGALKLGGKPIDLYSVDTPSYILSTVEDHIAPWKSTYAATRIYKGDIRFVLAGSGHVAGVVNPPDAKKYNHWINIAMPETADEWMEGAQEYPGSWWEDWQAWLEYNKFADDMVPARTPGLSANGQKTRIIEDAPGSYVKVRLKG